LKLKVVTMKVKAVAPDRVARLTPAPSFWKRPPRPRVDDTAAELDDALERGFEIRHTEVGQREAVARASSALVQTQGGGAAVSLKPLPHRLAPRLERELEQRLPKAACAIQVVGGKLDQVGGYAREHTAYNARVEHVRAVMLRVPAAVGSTVLPTWRIALALFAARSRRRLGSFVVE
jgi:hypothetical protein